MKIVFLSTILFSSLSFLVLACSGETESVNFKSSGKTSNDSIALFDSILIDERDGERYAIIKIGEQVWMAENLRYNCEGSMFNDANPSKKYGRYYMSNILSSICPKGWHMPTDSEWDQLEIAHAMPASFKGKDGWRGQHAVNLKSTTAWDETPDEQLKDDWTKVGNGTNLLGFNVLPAGYYFSEEMGEVGGMQGDGYAAGFWSAQENVVDNNRIVQRAFARFIFSPRTFVNKWPDDNNESGAALSCRCVMD